MITYEHLVKFILANRGDKVFDNCTEEQIVMEVVAGVNAGTLLYATDGAEKITGMILAEKRPDNILFVTRNLAMCKATLKLFAAEAKKRWPEHKLEWLKRGIYKHPNTDTLYKKLL